MVKDFRHWGHVHHPEPGEVYEWKDDEGIRYYSLLIQEASNSNHAHGLPGKASLHNLDKCLKNLAKKLEKDEVDSLAIPKMATGVGGLNWDEVKPHLYKYLDPLPTRVYVYTQYKRVNGQWNLNQRVFITYPVFILRAGFLFNQSSIFSKSNLVFTSSCCLDED